jgi:hypothetical protein
MRAFVVDKDSLSNVTPRPSTVCGKMGMAVRSAAMSVPDGMDTATAHRI